MPDPTKNPFFDAYPGLGGRAGGTPTPPFRLPGMEAGPSPPTANRNAYAGQVEPGNIDLGRRPRVKNPDGSISTVRSMGVNINGQEVLIPTVSDDGRVMSDDEAVSMFRRTGRHLGKFNSVDSSNAAAQRIHDDQEAMLGMPEMSEAEALKSEQGYFGPPVGRDINLSRPQESEPGAMEQRRVSPGPRGKVFVDRIEDDGTAVLIGADGETATTMKAQKGWKEGMYVDPPVRTRKRRAVP
jgi:hypothetical protein